MEKSKQRKIGAILSYISIIANTIVGLVYTPFMIRTMGQSEYGLYSLISSFIGYLTVLDLGFGNAVIVYTSKYRAQKKFNEEKKLHGMFFVIFCLIALIAGILGFILCFCIPKFFGKSMTSIELEKAKILMIILTFNLVFHFIFNIFSSIITAYEEFIFQKVLNILSIFLKPVIMVPILFLGYKSIAMALVVTFINILVMISNYLFCRKKLKVQVKFSGFDKALFKMIFNYSFFIFLNILVDRINYSVDKFILGSVCGTIAVSVYSAAASINDMFVNMSGAISGVLLPKVSKMIAKKATDEEITNEFIKVGRLQFYIIFLIASGFTLLGKEFITAWVGNNYINAYYIIVILMIPLCVPLIQNLGISILQAKNKHQFRSILYIAIAVVNIIISIPLAKRYEGIGSAIGTSLAVLIGNGLIINIYYYKKIHINTIKFWKNIIKMLIPCIIPIILIKIIMNFLDIHGYLYVFVLGSIYTSIYAIVCYMFIMNDYEKELIKKPIHKVLKKIKNKEVR